MRGSVGNRILSEVPVVKRTTPVILLVSSCLVGCGYQPAPMAPDPYTQSTFLGHDWPIGDGQPTAEPNPETMAGTVETEE